MSPDRPIIPVNEQGLDSDGFDYTWGPTPAALAEGLVATRDVLLQYPDGRLEGATEVLITKKGLARIGPIQGEAGGV